MTSCELLPDVNREFVGISDVPALSLEVNALRGELDELTSQMELERRLADDIHRARTVVILGSPALRQVFEVEKNDELAERQQIDTSDLLSGAFVREIPLTPPPEGFGETTSHVLRVAIHPDAGGDTELAKEIGGFLAHIGIDESYAIAKAMSTARRAEKHSQQDLETLRLERYRLMLALRGTVPTFETEEDARKTAQREIEGAEWRVRAVAATKCLQLILGDEEALNSFLRMVASNGDLNLANDMNYYLPGALSLQERLAKGEPMKTEDLDTITVDNALEKIWDTLGNKSADSIPPYSPPYQAWLRTIIPAMRTLDPGQKPGENYTHYDPPFRFERQRTRPSSGHYASQWTESKKTESSYEYGHFEKGEYKDFGNKEYYN